MKKLIVACIFVVSVLFVITVNAEKYENKCETYCDDYGNCTTKCTYDDDPDGGCFINSIK